SRNTPLLIQLFFLYYALPEFGIHLDSFACAIIGLSFLGGSYMAESLRAGIEAIKKQQYESGLSLGLNKWQNFRYVILPQALGIAMPSISANIIFLLKETSVVSIIALADLVYVAKDLIGLYYKSNEALFALVVCYLILILPLSLILNRIEKRLSYV
ncbi:amino acid ABC transporter permease, partial [Campylobacter volucris]